MDAAPMHGLGAWNMVAAGVAHFMLLVSLMCRGFNGPVWWAAENFVVESPSLSWAF